MVRTKTFEIKHHLTVIELCPGRASETQGQRMKSQRSVDRSTLALLWPYSGWRWAHDQGFMQSSEGVLTELSGLTVLKIGA
jgi:hypothetical protein